MSEFHSLENSLKDFLQSSQSDSYNSRGANLHKYNNLTIYVDLKKYSKPHFIVRVGISESAYKLDDCEKIAGGLGGDERYVRRWYDKPNVKTDLLNAWSTASRVQTVQKNTSE